MGTPDSGDFDDIDSEYICDHFIDCPNLSDESGDCDANYTALFIAFGIITGVLLLMTCCLIPFVIAISIYNLGFLAAVCIPVIIVLDYINPFASWVIRSISVLYAFTATLVLQFAPKVIGVLLVDRGRNTALPSLGKTTAL